MSKARPGQLQICVCCCAARAAARCFPRLSSPNCGAIVRGGERKRAFVPRCARSPAITENAEETRPGAFYAAINKRIERGLRLDQDGRRPTQGEAVVSLRSTGFGTLSDLHGRCANAYRFHVSKASDICHDIGGFRRSETRVDRHIVTESTFADCDRAGALAMGEKGICA